MIRKYAVIALFLAIGYFAIYCWFRFEKIIVHETSWLWDDKTRQMTVSGHWVHTGYFTHEYFRNESKWQKIARFGYGYLMSFEVEIWKLKYPIGSKWPYK